MERDDSSKSKPQKEGDTWECKQGPYDEIEMYLKKAKEDIYIALKSSNADCTKDQTETSKAQKPNRNASRNFVFPRSESFDSSSLYNRNISPVSKRKLPHRKFRRKFCSQYDRERPTSLKESKFQEWSQSLLKDFHNIVEQELNSFSNSDLGKAFNSFPDFNTYFSNLGEFKPKVSREELSSSVDSDSCVSQYDNTCGSSSSEIKMGGTQSSNEIENDNWLDSYANYKTYTLPRPNQRSISVIGERLASSGHPEDKNESCQLISVTQHRFSRSLSLDEGRGLSAWALHHLSLIDEAHKDRFNESQFFENPCNQDISLPEGIYGKIRKTGISEIDNQKILQTNSRNTDLEEYSERVSNGWSNQEEIYKNPEFAESLSDFRSYDSNFNRSPSRTPAATSTSALTVESLGEQDGENWSYVDDDDICSLTDRAYSSEVRMEQGSRSPRDGSNYKPDIVITTPNITGNDRFSKSDMISTQSSENIEDKSSNHLLKQRKLREGSGRKSEPTFPSPRVSPTYYLMGLPGLEVRRHTLPNPANKNVIHEVPGTPIFNTSSWQTLPPAEEMEVMEDKPIKIDKKQSDCPSKSLNSSLSSLSHLSLQDDFSDSESPSGAKSPQSFPENVIENNLSPDVYLDPSSVFTDNIISDNLNNLNVDQKPHKSEKSMKGVFVDTKPIIIKVTPKIIKSSKDYNDVYRDSRKIIHETQRSVLQNIDVNTPTGNPKMSKDQNTDELKVRYRETSFDEPSLIIAEQQDNINDAAITSEKKNNLAGKLSYEREAESDSCNDTLDRRKETNLSITNNLKGNIHDTDKVGSRKYDPLIIRESELLTDSSLDESVTSLLSKIDDLVQEKNQQHSQDQKNSSGLQNIEVIFSVRKQSQSEGKKENVKAKSSSKGTFADLQLFLQEVETRIPTSKGESGCSSSYDEKQSPISPVISHSSGEILPYQSPMVVFDASTQTSSTPTPACDSPTFSFTWISESGCDATSLEPCPSSIVLSGTEDDFEEEDVSVDPEEDDEWWAEEESLSSSHIETPISLQEDDSSLSLSESLDNLDQNIESGIGTVSTRQSVSPPMNSTALDLSGSNQSSEDTGLETSFERRVRRYLPNARGHKFNGYPAHYRRRRPRFRQGESWVRCENQTTQTEPQQLQHSQRSFSGENAEESNRDKRASSEEAPRPWKDNGVEDQMRHTHSEPRLSAYSNQNVSLRVVNSEVMLPPLPHSHPNCRSFYVPSPLPTLSEGQSISKSQYVRPRNLSLGEVSIPSKAISAPVLERGLLRGHLSTSAISPAAEISTDTTILPGRTQSAKEISEIEALEACKWLRAAGFPQYAQMYEDFQFPLDLVSVERDHSFLDADSLQALFRRLRILNRCAKIRLDSNKKNNAEDSEDEEQQCALSGNWTFQRHSRRWSRIDTMQLQLPSKGVDLRACGLDTVGGVNESSDEVNLGQFKRSGSERLKDGAKAFLRRMESLKNKKKRKHREGIIISSPKVLDEELMQVRMTELGCIEISPDATPEIAAREKHSVVHLGNGGDLRAIDAQFIRDSSRQTTPGEDSSSLASDHSQTSTPRFRTRRRKRFWRRGFSGDAVGICGGDGEGVGMGVSGAYSDSECSPPTWRHYVPDANSNTKLGTYIQCPDNLMDKPRPSLRHASSLTYGKESQKVRDNFIASLRGMNKSHDGDDRHSPNENRIPRDGGRQSIYDNVPLVICNKSYHDYHSEGTDIDMGTQEGSGSSECTMESRESPLPPSHEDDIEERQVRRATIDRWHSFNRKSSSMSLYQRIGTQLYGFSVGQMNHLRKRALLKLTALMERYCPSNRTTWNWELPKFIRKIKSPDYKDRIVFGVPLQVINQRTGQPLPLGIQQALFYLKTNCIDQVGIFRKPGVRSRIQKLRELHELEEEVEYSSFGPCDIADMVKTYFRELPEVLLTNKLSEIFIAVCQYLPIEVRVEALQCIMLMMHDENREVLMTLLNFLSDVAANAHLNQMTASNLAVCMAPSLFHLNMGGSASSPLRRKTTGAPEQKDLHDNKSAHQCLTLMIEKISCLERVPMEMLSNCRFSFLDLSQPVALEDLGSSPSVTFTSNQGEGDWMAYMNACIESLLKESRERTRGWVHLSYPDPLVDVGYRKVGDGHPLRLWKVTTEVEAPPADILTRVLRERHLWDETLLKWRVVTKLNRQAEVFQYMCSSMYPRLAVDYCVLRCWRTDLGKGLCVVVETSVEHSEAPSLPESTRGIVLASRYMIQPCGSGKSRITHISRVDMRGRLPEWYNKNYAFFTANHLVKLRQSFQHFASGPESKV